jgi:predicted N-acetyltransferase YhbS
MEITPGRKRVVGHVEEAEVSTEIEEEDETHAADDVSVRDLREGDLAPIVRIDRASTGRLRREYYEAKLRAAIAEPKLRMSLVAELDDHVVGFLLARVYFGEFGRMEPAAVIDSLGVDPEYRNRHVGAAMMRQLLANLTALRVERIETQVDWDQFDLLAFLAKCGFRPAPRLCLERRLDADDHRGGIE